MLDVSSWLVIFSTFGILYIFYKHVTRNNSFFAKRGIPYADPKLLFGSTREFFFEKIQLTDYLQQLYDRMPNER